MSSDAGSQSSGPATSGQPGDGEAGRIQSLEDRFGKIEAEQARQGGILAEIKELVGGPKAGTSPPASGSSQPPAPPGTPSVADQVRKGVEEIEAKKAADAKAAADADADRTWRASVDERLAERKPAEPGTGFRNRLQRALVGRPDS